LAVRERKDGTVLAMKEATDHKTCSHIASRLFVGLIAAFDVIRTTGATAERAHGEYK